MKKLPKMYKHLFDDKEIRTLLLGFYTPNWVNMETKDKVEMIKRINDKVASIYGYKAPRIVTNKEEANHYGAFSSFEGVLLINERCLDEYSGYENCDTYFHELRHYFQHRAVENELNTDKESADPFLVEKWDENFLQGNYFDATDYKKYIIQPVEKDAWSTGMLFARAVHILINKAQDEGLVAKDKNKEDLKAWNSYAILHKDIVVSLISENPISEKIVGEVEDEIKETYKSKQKDRVQYNLGEIYKTKLLKKGIDNLDFKEICVLLSNYCYVGLDISTQVEVLKKYYSFIKTGTRNIKIEKKTTSSISIGKEIVDNQDPIAVLNVILSQEYRNLIDYYLLNKKSNYHISKERMNLIKLNLAKNKNGKKINFVSDYVDAFFYPFQPFAIEESEYVSGEFKKIALCEKEAFKKNFSEWKRWFDFYNNHKIFKTSEMIYGVKYSKWENYLIEVYTNRILLDKQGKLELGKNISLTNSKQIQQEIYKKLQAEQNKNVPTALLTVNEKNSKRD